MGRWIQETKYNLTAFGENLEDYRDSITCSLREKHIIDWAIDDDWESYEDVDWCTHERDVKSLSKEFPDLFFILSGEDLEQCEEWDKYFKNGERVYSLNY